MEVTRKRILFGKITTFVNPANDLLLDKKEKIFLHYLPDGNKEETNRSAIKYKLVKHAKGYFLKPLGFFNYETAAKKYVRGVVKSKSSQSETKRTVEKEIRHLPDRAKKILLDALEEKVEPEIQEETVAPPKEVEINEPWVEKVAESFSIKDFTVQDEVVLKGKSGSEHMFDSILSSNEKGKERIAILSRLSDNPVDDITNFNSNANDCEIDLRVFLRDRKLDRPLTDLLDRYHILIYDRKLKEVVKPPPATPDSYEFDNLLFGSMKRGKVYMISGKPGVGKTLLATRYLIRGAARGENGAILLTGSKGAEYIENAKRFDPEFEGYYRKDAIQVIELSDEITSYKDSILKGSRDFTNYVRRVSSEIKKIVDHSKIERLVVDPVSSLIGPSEKLVNMLFGALILPKTTVVVTNIAAKSDVSLFGFEEYYVSGIVRLEKADDNKSLIKVVTMRTKDGTSESPPIYFRIDDLNGSGPVPISKSPQAS